MYDGACTTLIDSPPQQGKKTNDQPSLLKAVSLCADFDMIDRMSLWTGECQPSKLLGDNEGEDLARSEGNDKQRLSQQRAPEHEELTNESSQASTTFCLQSVPMENLEMMDDRKETMSASSLKKGTR